MCVWGALKKHWWWCVGGGGGSTMHQTATSSQLISRGSGVWQQPVDMSPDLRLQPTRAHSRAHTHKNAHEQSVTPVRGRATCTHHDRACALEEPALVSSARRRGKFPGGFFFFFLIERADGILPSLGSPPASDGRRQRLMAIANRIYRR